MHAKRHTSKSLVILALILGVMSCSPNSLLVDVQQKIVDEKASNQSIVAVPIFSGTTPGTYPPPVNVTSPVRPQVQ